MTRRKRVLVTGAASGIGRATCKLLAGAGTAVGGLDANAADLHAVVDGLVADGLRATAAPTDVTDLAAVQHAVDAIADELGGLDGVVNVAGVGGYTGDVTATTPEEWRHVLDVNLTGVFHVSRCAVPHLRASGGGAIVNVSSQYGLRGGADSPAYCASKAGVIGLTRAMAIDHAPEIVVSCLCPGPVETPMLTRSLDQEAAGGREAARTRGRLLAGRAASPVEIAEAIVFLLGAGFATGSVVSLDGGWTAG